MPYKILHNDGLGGRGIRIMPENASSDCILSHSKHDLNYNKVIIWLHGLDDSPYPWASLLSSLISEIFQPDIDSDNNLSYMSSKLRVKVILPSASYIEITVNNGLKMSAWSDMIYLSHNRIQEDKISLDISSKRIGGIIQKELEVGLGLNDIALIGYAQGGALALHTGLRYSTNTDFLRLNYNKSFLGNSNDMLNFGNKPLDVPKLQQKNPTEELTENTQLLAPNSIYFNPENYHLAQLERKDLRAILLDKNKVKEYNLEKEKLFRDLDINQSDSSKIYKSQLLNANLNTLSPITEEEISSSLPLSSFSFYSPSPSPSSPSPSSYSSFRDSYVGENYLKPDVLRQNKEKINIENSSDTSISSSCYLRDIFTDQVVNTPGNSLACIVSISGWLPFEHEYPSAQSFESEGVKILQIHGKEDDLISLQLAKKSNRVMEEVLKLHTPPRFITFEGVKHAVDKNEVIAALHFIKAAFSTS